LSAVLKHRQGTWATLKPVLFVFAPVLAIFTLTLNGIWSTDHTVSFLQLEWAIWKDHAFTLGPASTFSSPSADDFVYKGFYYIAAAPGLSVMSLPFGAIGFMLDGHFTPFGKGLLYSEFFVALTDAIAAYIVFRIARLIFSQQKTAYFLAFCYAFATLTWPYATFLFASDTSAMFDLLAAYFALVIMGDGVGNSRLRYWILCGLAIAGGLTVDYVNAALILVVPGFLALFELARSREPVNSSKLFWNCLSLCLTSALGILLIADYNYVAFGDYFTSSEQLYLHSATLLGNFTYPLYEGVILNLFTPFRGLIVFCPILILGIPGLYCMVRAKGSSRDSALFLFTIFLALLLPYSAWYDVMGGLSYGARLVVPAIPFLLIPAGFLMDGKSSRKVTGLAYALYAASATMNGIAALVTTLGPGSPPTGYSIWTYFAFLSSSPSNNSEIANFAKGSLDSWWKSNPMLGSYWWAVACAIIGAAVLFPLPFILKSEKRVPPDGLKLEA
jgi:hypothetical protein